MENIQSCDYGIHVVLRGLIERKSNRDHIKFTTYQLAKAIGMPHSIITKLVHPDPGKRVHNPRIDTLVRIVNFFKQDGFSVTLDDLLSSLKARSVINVPEQETGAFLFLKSIPLYSMRGDQKESVGIVDIKLTTDSENIIAFISDEDIKPMFKAESIFIVDVSLEPEHENLVAIKDDNHHKIIIRKLYVESYKKILKSYDHSIAPIDLSSKHNYKILGVIIQVNAKT